MLPKSDNSALINVLENDNKFDYDNDTIITATDEGYKMIEKEKKSSVLDTTYIEPINIKVTDALKQKQNL